uniref:TFIIS central domain-containing protein n=1 Tax=Brassica oleracea TaxID=3712 RepID=A0A3P6GWM7_BRAOL|nr:unnamed protein product [Brassica oleracea]
MEKQEFLELFEAATKAAKSAVIGDGKSSSPTVFRCVEAMIRLKEAPESLACELVTDRRYPQTGKSHILLMDDKNPRIQSEAKLLYTLLLRVHNQQVVVKNKNNKKKLVEEEMIWTKTGILTGTKCMKEGVVSCDSWSVAASVESAMFERLGSFEAPQKAKYRSILFNIGDSSNPDLRRKVLIGERLVTMEKEEMASNKIQMQVQKIKEKARVKEENRVKSMMMFQSGSVIMT